MNTKPESVQSKIEDLEGFWLELEQTADDVDVMRELNARHLEALICVPEMLDWLRSG